MDGLIDAAMGYYLPLAIARGKDLGKLDYEERLVEWNSEPLDPNSREEGIRPIDSKIAFFVFDH